MVLGTSWNVWGVCLCERVSVCWWVGIGKVKLSSKESGGSEVLGCLRSLFLCLRISVTSSILGNTDQNVSWRFLWRVSIFFFPQIARLVWETAEICFFFNLIMAVMVKFQLWLLGMDICTSLIFFNCFLNSHVQCLFFVLYLVTWNVLFLKLLLLII